MYWVIYVWRRKIENVRRDKPTYVHCWMSNYWPDGFIWLFLRKNNEINSFQYLHLLGRGFLFRLHSIFMCHQNNLVREQRNLANGSQYSIYDLFYFYVRKYEKKCFGWVRSVLGCILLSAMRTCGSQVRLLYSNRNPMSLWVYVSSNQRILYKRNIQVCSLLVIVS